MRQLKLWPICERASLFNGSVDVLSKIFLFNSGKVYVSDIVDSCYCCCYHVILLLMIEC